MKRLAEHVMARNPQSIADDLPLETVARMMRDLDVGCLPVVAGERVAGILTDRDIVIRALAAGKDPKATLSREIMTPGTSFCYEHQGVDEVAKDMAKRKVMRMPVLNKENRVVGVIALSDISSAVDRPAAGSVLEAIAKDR